MPLAGRPRILFVAEAVTLAHVARPQALARGLDPARFEIVFASERRFGLPQAGPGLEHRPIRSIEPARFLRALAAGSPVYDASTLESYVADDLALIAEVRPDAVVGDFRLSLSASARLAGVPYLAITNAYWSPHRPGPLPLPDLPMARFLGLRLARRAFALAWPVASALHARPLDRVRRRHGLPSLGPDLRRTYTDADHVLYADVPELAPTVGAPDHHHYLGPIPWSPSIPPPLWWADLPDDRPIIYATPGSSGRPGMLDAILRAVDGMPIGLIAASAGRAASGPIPSNARVEAYLPGALAASRSTLVISNGGSPTSYQALAAGAPVLGLAGNLDQHLSIGGIVDRGAGLMLRAERARPRAIRRAVEAILGDPSFRRAAAGLAPTFARHDSRSRFLAILERALGPAGPVKPG